MNLKPTNIPLSVKDFEKEICGYCLGCGCHCGYIAYIKDEKVVDIYGHPYDINSVGSLCNKGIALIGETDINPLRIRKPYIRDGNELKEVSIEYIKNFVKKNIQPPTAVILGKFSSVEDYALLSNIGEVYTTGVFLPFKPSSIPPYQWKDVDLIIAIEVDPVLSEVMSIRWIIDALEKGAYLVNISSRFNTLSSKASENFLISPPQIKYALNSLIEGKEEPWIKIRKYIESSKRVLILVGETILKSPFRTTLLNFVHLMRKNFKVEYSFIGNITNIKCKELKDINLQVYKSVISIDNTLYEFESLPQNQFRISFSLFPDTTAIESNAIFPISLFTESTISPFFNCFGYKTKSINIKEPPLKATHLLIKEIFGEINRKGKLDIFNTDIHSVKIENEDTDFSQEDLFLVIGESMVETWGHWYPWLHSIEQYQKAYINEKTAKKFNIGPYFKGLNVEITPMVADNIVFIPESFEEIQPFNPGLRKGRILNKPGYRIWRYKNEY